MPTDGSTLVIVEALAEWPRFLDDATGIVSFVQGPEESLPEFHGRVERCIARLTSSSTEAVVVCGPDPEQGDESRRSLLSTLITHLEAGGEHGRLALVSAPDYASRRELSALTLEVNEFLAGLGSPVSCRFRSRPPARAFSVSQASEPHAPVRNVA